MKNFTATPSTINLPSQSILKKVKDGSNLNWVFIPGGPGLGTEYLEIGLRNSQLQGSIYVLQFPKYQDISTSDLQRLIYIHNDLKCIQQNLKDVILVGHSFGGMLLQTLPIKDLAIFKNIILLCSSPNLKCFELAGETFKKFTNFEQQTINDYENKYFENQNNTTFKELFKAWAPYYVEVKHQEKFTSDIDDTTVDFHYYEWGVRFFYKYFEENGAVTEDIIVIGVKEDKICPPSLFIGHANKYVLEGSSHFPWIENVQNFHGAIQNIESRIISQKTIKGTS